jgi:hypothetical protein
MQAFFGSLAAACADSSSTTIPSTIPGPPEMTQRNGMSSRNAPKDRNSQRLEALDKLFDTKWQEFEAKNLVRLRDALHQVDERWTRIERALKGWDSVNEENGTAYDSPMPGAFPLAVTPSSPTTSSFSSTASESRNATSKEVRDAKWREEMADHVVDWTEWAEAQEEEDTAEPAWTTVSRHKKGPSVNTDIKTSSIPVAVKTATVVPGRVKKPTVLVTAKKTPIVTTAAKPITSKPAYPLAPAIPGIENVVESRGHRLQILKNELRMKGTPKLIDVEPDGDAVRRLDPRPCHKYVSLVCLAWCVR